MSRLFEGNAFMVRQARTLYVLIRQKNGVTRQVLSEQLDLPATSLNRMLERQITAGLIEEYDLAESTGGRRPGLYRLNRQKRFLLGVDWRPRSGVVVLADTSLEIIDQLGLAGFEGMSAECAAAALTASTGKLLAERHIDEDQILGLGLCVPDCCLSGETTPDWRKILEMQAATPVCLLPDHDAGFYAGLWQVRENAADSLLYLSIGQTVRSGMALNGQLHDDVLSISPADSLIIPLPDKSGQHELGQIVTIPALTRRFQRSKEDPGLGWADFCQAVRDDKRKARQIIRDAAFAAAVAMHNMAVMTRSDHVLITGTALDDLPEYEHEIRAASDQLERKTHISPAIMTLKGGEEGRAAGAAAYVLETSLNAQTSVL